MCAVYNDERMISKRLLNITALNSLVYLSYFLHLCQIRAQSAIRYKTASMIYGDNPATERCLKHDDKCTLRQGPHI